MTTTTDTDEQRPSFSEWLDKHRPANSHRPWTTEEIARLDDELRLYSMDWQRIAERHSRSVAAVKKKASMLGGPR